MLVEAIANATSINPTAVRNELTKFENFDTVLGKFAFGADGDAVYSPTALIVRNGQLEAFG